MVWRQEAKCEKQRPGGFPFRERRLVSAVPGCVQNACRALEAQNEEFDWTFRVYYGSGNERPPRRTRASATVTAQRLLRSDPKEPGPKDHWLGSQVPRAFSG